jgi:hypothetical protein
MKDQLGIVFLHHNCDPVTENNLRSIREHNPGATIVTMSAGTPFPGGYTVEQTPLIRRLHSRLVRQSGDWLLCSWFTQRQEICDKWWVVEWDTFCTVSVREYYRLVWDYPFVASSVRLTYREPEWSWFQIFETKSPPPLPEDYRPYLMGAVPFCYLLSEPALAAICTMLLKHPLTAGNCELRFTTAANRCGYLPCGFSPPNDQITWITWKTLPPNPAIAHPIKHKV